MKGPESRTHKKESLSVAWKLYAMAYLIFKENVRHHGLKRGHKKKVKILEETQFWLSNLPSMPEDSTIIG